jgi:hypothetical protein
VALQELMAIQVAAQKMELLKATDVSLASGPLHSEVMSAAKAGGYGRIMLEFNPS